jgi:DNA-binding GntR family transcriptional regulator
MRRDSASVETARVAVDSEERRTMVDGSGSTSTGHRLETMSDGHRFARTVAKDRLCTLMIRGAVPFDVPMSERSLAEAVGLGRMPVREALRDLAQDGVVAIEPGRGTFLRRLDRAEVVELYEARVAIEGFAARAAAKKSFVGDLSELLVLLRALRERSDLDPAAVAEAEALGDRLHAAVVRGAGNRMLEEMYARIRLRIRISLRLLQRRDPARILATLDEHVAIADAILARDGQRALTATRNHLRRGHKVTLANFDALLLIGERRDSASPEGAGVGGARRRGRPPAGRKPRHAD